MWIEKQGRPAQFQSMNRSNTVLPKKYFSKKVNHPGDFQSRAEKISGCTHDSEPEISRNFADRKKSDSEKLWGRSQFLISSAAILNYIKYAAFKEKKQLYDMKINKKVWLIHKKKQKIEIVPEDAQI